MSVFELIIFLVICAAFGFIGHLISPRYGWIVGSALGALVLILLGTGSFKKIIKPLRQRKNRRE